MLQPIHPCPGKRIPFAWAVLLVLGAQSDSLVRAESPSAFTAGPAIELRTGNSGPDEIHVLGLSPVEVALLRKALERHAWSELFQVRVGSEPADQDERPPILGRYEQTNDGAVFRPRFPLRPNLNYLADFGFSPQRDYLQQVVSLPRPNGKPTRVVQIYPTTDLIPENLLRFHIEFSAPMRQGRIYRYIGLFDDMGVEVELPFLEIEQELWSRDGQRVMLLLDPGRVKRELKPRIDSGPALVADRQYELRICAEWPDANGNPLKNGSHKRFQVGGVDNVCPAPQRWRVQSPASATRNALVVHFAEPLDFAMLQRVLTVRDENGRELAGTVATTRNETEWHFRPATNWIAGQYSIRVATSLEDLAGNSIAKPFEVDLSASPQQRDVGGWATVAFEIVPGAR